MRACQRCGKECADNEKFCSGCGAKLLKREVPQDPPEEKGSFILRYSVFKKILALVLVFVIVVVVLAIYKDTSTYMPSPPKTIAPTPALQPPDNPVVNEFEPYLNKIILNNKTIRSKAVSIVKDCPTANKECYVAKIYHYVVANYKYFSDPRSGDTIQTPFETMEIGGGNCVDLTILLISLLENVGIKTYFVISKTETHAYSLACVDIPTDLNKYQELAIDISSEPGVIAPIPQGFGQINYYNIKNESCVILEATAGKRGYAGEISNISKGGTAIDAVSKEYSYLE